MAIIGKKFINKRARNDHRGQTCITATRTLYIYVYVYGQRSSRAQLTFSDGKIYFIVSNRLEIVFQHWLAPQFTQLEFDEAKGDDAE